MKKTKLTGVLAAAGGAGTIEFALVATFLCTLLLGVLDFGLGFWEYMQVGNAARAGAEYAVANGFNAANIETAVTSATTLSSITASPAPTEACGCPNVASGVTAATCGSACVSGGTAGEYVTVHPQASYRTLISWPTISDPVTLAASATVKLSN
jgi:Flp pilus assembly protein TadG